MAIFFYSSELSNLVVYAVIVMVKICTYFTKQTGNDLIIIIKYGKTLRDSFTNKAKD